MKLTFTRSHEQPTGGLLVNANDDVLNIVPDGEGGLLVYLNGTLMGGLGDNYND